VSCNVNCKQLCIVGVVKQITYPIYGNSNSFSVIVENKNKIKFDCKEAIQNKDRCEYFVFCKDCNNDNKDCNNGNKDCNNGKCEEVLIRSEAEETLNGNGDYMFKLLLSAYNNKDIVEIVYCKNQNGNKIIEKVSIYKEDGI